MGLQAAVQLWHMPWALTKEEEEEILVKCRNEKILFTEYYVLFERRKESVYLYFGARGPRQSTRTKCWSPCVSTTALWHRNEVSKEKLNYFMCERDKRGEFLTPQHGASSIFGCRNGLQYGG
jgi:hypothetical protein